MQRFIFSCLLCLGGLASLTAQSVTQFDSWWNYFGNHHLNDQLTLHTEYQWRRSDFASHWQQSLLLVGLNQKVADQTTLGGGYGWIISFPYGAFPIAAKTNEHRMYEELIMNNGAGRFGFNHRYRLEQRWLENASLSPAGVREVNGYTFKNRARYRLLVTYPLNHRTMQDHTLFLATFDEVFLGFGNGIVKNILDQNQLYFGLGYRFNADGNFQLGYLNQRIIKSDGLRQENDHTLQTALTYNLDFRKHN